MRRIAPVIALISLVLAGCGGQDVMSLRIGDCFDENASLQQGGEVSSVPDIDCDEPHDFEVFHLADYAGSTFSPARIDDFAIESCYAAFSRYVGRSYESSSLDFTWLSPTPDGWDEGDREIVCVAYRMDMGKLRGSVRGSGL